MSTPLFIAIAGANGRMGQELVKLCHLNQDINFTTAYVRSGSQLVGENIMVCLPELNLDMVYKAQNDVLTQHTNMLIDFTLPENTITNLKKSVSENCAMVIGTTGFTLEQQQQIVNASAHIPILQASNMSVGVNLSLALIEKAALALGESVSVTISETHHTHKIDSPSGTAITMGEVIANSHDKNLSDCMIIDDKKIESPQPGKITFNSIREGEVIGDHTVKFFMDGETVEISHHAINRQIFAKGALKAAKWLVDKKPGLYSMKNVLGL